MSELSHEQQTYLARFIHPEKTYPALTEEMIATILAIPVLTYRQIKVEIAAAVQQSADELLANPEFASRVDRLPFAPGSTVVGLGDSITDDWESWLELLRHLLSIRRPNDNIRVVNAGISGETTTHMVARTFYGIAAEKPDWLICMAGTHDRREYRGKPLEAEAST